MSGWTDIEHAWSGCSYSWPGTTCCTLMHDVLSAELGVNSPYGETVKRYGTEGAMVRDFIWQYGDLGAAHAWALAQCGVAQIVDAPSEYLGVLNDGYVPRFAYVDQGPIYIVECASGHDSDGAYWEQPDTMVTYVLEPTRMGRMLIGSPTPGVYMWIFTDRGLRQAYPETVSRVWSW